MARQRGAVEFLGRIGNMIYYRNSLAGRIVGRQVSADWSSKVKHDSSFELFRHYGKILGAASHCCKLLRTSLGDAISDISDGSMNSRLVKIGKLIIAGKLGGDVHPFHTKEVLQLRHFYFNENQSVTNFIKTSYGSRIEDGEHITSFEAIKVHPLYYSKFYQVGSFVVGINFETEDFEGYYAMSEKLVSNREKAGPEFDLKKKMPEGYPVYFHVVAIRQYDEKGGEYYVFNNPRGHGADIENVWLGEG